ncbi:MAG TPA: hypothetical protein VL866_21455 [Pyrinomonadaceae bacterium]|nr:hypothetical protein [Pyrinomonadaceae bacterium]
MELKENVVYTLPDGRELIARLGSTGFLLHDPTKGVAAAPVFVVDRLGRLLSWGRITSWTKQDLSDTGRISLPQIQRLQII